MRRRHFVAGLGAVVLTWPFAARAQRAAIPFVGYLSVGSPNEREGMLDSFRQGLKEGGYADGKDVALEFRWAEGRFDRLPKMAADLVKRNVSVIVTSGGPASALAARDATRTIPVVFITTDPVELGLVASLSRPGGNVTGVASTPISLEAKRLQILRDLLPAAAVIAYLQNPSSPAAKRRSEEVRTAASATGTRILALQAGTARELDAAFSAIKKSGANALVVATDGFFTTRRGELIELAATHGIPAIYHRREFAVEGGLVSYGPDYADGYRQLGLTTARILKGAKPADLPVIQAAKFELVVNLKTAGKLGLNVPKAFLAGANEVIQ